MRKHLLLVMSIVLLGGAAGAMLRGTGNLSADPPRADEMWSTKKVMRKLHSGKQALVYVVSNDLQKAEPDWQTDEKNLAEIIRLMSMLTKHKPLRGGQQAWDKLVQDYVEKCKDAQKNVKERKSQPALVALEKLSSTCDDCHDNHGIK